MKKIVLCTTLFMGLFLVACSSSNDSSGTSNVDIYGKAAGGVEHTHVQ